MIRHFLLFSFPDEMPEAETAEILREAALLPERIPEISSFHLGETFDAVMPPRWGTCMSMEFEDEAALRRYIDHPAHVTFRDLFRSKVHDRMTHTVRALRGA
jgi:hypothetical protein